MQTDVAVAHFALDLRLGNESRDGVDDDHVDRAAADQRLGDLERVLTGVGLCHKQGVHVYAQCRGIVGIERVLNVDKRHVAAVLLTLCDAVEREGGFTRGFGSEDLDDTTSRQAADAQRDVQ